MEYDHDTQTQTQNTHLVLSDLKQTLVARPRRQEKLRRKHHEAVPSALLYCVATQVVEQLVLHVSRLTDLVQHLEQLKLNGGHQHFAELSSADRSNTVCRSVGVRLFGCVRVCVCNGHSRT